MNIITVSSKVLYLNDTWKKPEGGVQMIVIHYLQASIKG